MAARTAKTHKAIQVVGAFNTDVTKATALTERETPSAGADEVLVRILCRPINPSDTLVYQGRYPPFKFESLPFTLGMEGMGTISEVGKHVKHLHIGQRVVPLIRDPGLTGQGSWQEYIVMPASRIVPVPDSVSDVTASQFLVNPWTVYAQFDILQVPKGQYVILSAATSVIGRQIVQYAKHIGIKTINLVRKDEQIEELKGIGADEVINYTTGDPVNRVKQITGGTMAYGAIDVAGGDVTKILTSSVRRSGTVILLGAVAGRIAEINVHDFLFRDLKLHGFILWDWWTQISPQKFSDVGSTIMKLLEKKVLVPHSGEQFPLDRYVEAIAKAQQSGRGGKVFLVT